jgi:hypothetical protein
MIPPAEQSLSRQLEGNPACATAIYGEICKEPSLIGRVEYQWFLRSLCGPSDTG